MKAEEVRISEWEGYQRKDFKLDGHECILVMPKEVHPGNHGYGAQSFSELLIMQTEHFLKKAGILHI